MLEPLPLISGFKGDKAANLTVFCAPGIPKELLKEKASSFSTDLP